MNSHSFIRILDRAGELNRIKKAVSPSLEITEITDRISKLPGGGKALLFENTGTDFPVLINSLGSAERIRLAFREKKPDQLADDIQSLIGRLTRQEKGIFGPLGKLPMLGKASRWMPRRSKRKGTCQEVISENPDLRKLPILTCWPHDGGPFVTLPLVHTRDPISGTPNLGMYRMQVFDERTTGMHWHMHKTGARHFREHSRLGTRMPVAVALGGDPVYTYCATAPLPDGIDEYLLAGFIRNQPVTMVKCITQDLWVPEDCDFVLEGYVDPSEELVIEGPFGDHTGFYSLEDRYPKFHLTAITHRKDAIYPATIVGIPPQEDAWLEWATERLFEPLIRLSMAPEMVNFHMPTPGVAHNLVLSSIQTSYPGQARKVLNTLWGTGQLMFTKFAIVANQEAPLSRYLEFARYVSERVDPYKHVIITTGPLDILDHTGSAPAFGGKMGIDATGEPFPTVSDDGFESPSDHSVAEFRSHHPEIMDMDLSLITKGVSIGLISLQKSRSGQVREIADDLRFNPEMSKVRFWFVYDYPVCLVDPFDLVWLAGAHVDPARDVKIYGPAEDSSTGMLVMDATIKRPDIDGFDRPWPNPVVMSNEMIELVDQDWDTYGLGGFIESPSRKYSALTRRGNARLEY